MHRTPASSKYILIISALSLRAILRLERHLDLHAFVDDLFYCPVKSSLTRLREGQNIRDLHSPMRSKAKFQTCQDKRSSYHMFLTHTRSKLIAFLSKSAVNFASCLPCVVGMTSATRCVQPKLDLEDPRDVPVTTTTTSPPQCSPQACTAIFALQPSSSPLPQLAPHSDQCDLPIFPLPAIHLGEKSRPMIIDCPDS
jgi:hypothetical protein